MLGAHLDSWREESGLFPRQKAERGRFRVKVRKAHTGQVLGRWRSPVRLIHRGPRVSWAVAWSFGEKSVAGQRQGLAQAVAETPKGCTQGVKRPGMDPGEKKERSREE